MNIRKLCEASAFIDILRRSVYTVNIERGTAIKNLPSYESKGDGIDDSRRNLVTSQSFSCCYLRSYPNSKEEITFT